MQRIFEGHCAAGLCVACLAAVLCVAQAQVPHLMNYQVMLTDDTDEPLADQSVELVFRLYDQEVGGGALWNETHNTVTNSIGVASVLLGSASAMSLLFDTPLWLQVEVDGEIMSPRRPLAAAPYALTARNSDYLGGEEAGEYALDDDLSQTGTLNDPGNPLEWTRLKSVPSGFADGVDNAGSGDGHSLDAADGDPTNVVYVAANGKVQIGGTPFASAKLSVTAAADERCASFRSISDQSWAPAISVKSDSTHGILVNSGVGTFITPGSPAAVAAYGATGSKGGYFVTYGSGDAMVCDARETGNALTALAEDGYSGYFSGGLGLHGTISDGYPVALFESFESTGYADAADFYSPDGVSSSTYTVYSSCYEGNAGRFRKRDDSDAKYGLYVNCQSSSSEGLYVNGTIVSTGSMAQTVETSRGRDAVFAVAASEVELIASGKGQLVGGIARVAFDDVFSESVSGPDGLRVTATPIGGWSALYVESIDARGFDLRSEAGAKDVEFHWVAVGRSAALERRPHVTIPDPAVEREIEDQKMAEVRSRRPARPETPTETMHAGD